MPIGSTRQDFSLVVVCVECVGENIGVASTGLRMQAVSGRCLDGGGFIYQCPRCKRKVSVMHVEQRFSSCIEVSRSKSRRKREPYER